MEGTFSLKVTSPGGRTLALRKGCTWLEICDHLKAMGDDRVQAIVRREDEFNHIVLTCVPICVFPFEVAS